MAKEETEGEKEHNTEEEKPKSKKKLFIIIGLVVVLLAAGVPLFLMKGGSKEKEDEAKAHGGEAEHHYQIAKLETFIVNLSQTGAFLKTVVLLEYDEEAVHKIKLPESKGGGGHEAKGGEELPAAFEHKLPYLRDAIIKVLSSKRAEEVLSVDGKEQMKTEIIEAVNQIFGLDEGPVMGVYYMEFIVQ